MKTTIAFKIVFVLSAVLLTYSCSKEEEADNLTSVNSYFPLEVGRYWKYDCVYKHGTTSSSSDEEESETTVQVIAQISNKSFRVKIFKGSVNVYIDTITVNSNGDILNEEDKMVLCLSKSQLNPNEYKSVLQFPTMAGGTWIPSGKIYFSKSGDMLDVKYDDKETYASATSSSRGETDHYFVEKFEKGVGITYTAYIRSTSISNYIPSQNRYVYGGSYSSWIYTLTETGVSEIDE